MFKWLQKLFGCGSKSACSCGCAGEGVDKVRELEHFVDYVVRALVDYPDEVNVSSRAVENGTVIRIDCRKEDIGKVVGTGDQRTDRHNGLAAFADNFTDIFLAAVDTDDRTIFRRPT